jgi:hypothetical protein
MPGTTPVYGFPYPEPTDLVADYPALGQQLAEDIEDVLPGIGGLAAVAPTSIANSGGSASTTGNTTTFSGVSSVSLNGVFSSTYENYRVVLTHVVSTGTPNLLMRYRLSGADRTDSLYTTDQSFSGGANRTDNQTQHLFLDTSTEYQSAQLDVIGPNLARFTSATGLGLRSVSRIAVFFGGVYRNAIAVDGLTIYPGSGTLTGSICVYGYRK